MAKKNVIFDIDNTLVHTVFNTTPHNPKLYNILKHHKDDELTVFMRPGLDDFLDDVFSKYNVSVWTAGNKVYADYICNLIMKDRKLDFIYSSWHCSQSNKNRGSDTYISTYGFNPTKDLRYVYERNDGYTPLNTVLVDDLYYTYLPQSDNVIFCEYFNVFMPMPHKDRYLYKLSTDLDKRFR